MAKIAARNTRRKGITSERDTPTLLEHFSNYLLGDKCKPSTEFWYRKHLKIVFVRLPFETLADWTAEKVLFLIADMVREKYSDSYVYNIYRTIKRFDEFLVKWNYIPKVQSVKPLLNSPKKPEPEILPLYPHQVEAMFVAADKHSYNPLRDKAILSVFYDSGIRRGELATLLLENIDTEMKKITVTGKMGKRTCGLGPIGMRDLKRYIANERPLGDEPVVFLGQTGKPMNVTHITQVVHRMAERAGVDKKYRGPHALRHGFAYAYIMNGGDAITLASQLGHNDMDMTQRYVHVVADDTAELRAEHSPMKNMKSLGERTERIHGNKEYGKANSNNRVKRRKKKR